LCFVATDVRAKGEPRFSRHPLNARDEKSSRDILRGSIRAHGWIRNSRGIPIGMMTDVGQTASGLSDLSRAKISLLAAATLVEAFYAEAASPNPSEGVSRFGKKLSCCLFSR
jgi:hypothetical protein